MRTRIRTVVFILLILTATAALAQPTVPPRIAPGFKNINEADLRADLTFLASDPLQGRMSLQAGDEVSVQWVAAEFAKAGLKPAFGDSYLQAVPMIEFRNDRQQSFLSMQHAGSEKKWQFPDAYGAFPRDVDLTAPAVFAGFGITAPELGYDDYKGLDAKGKIVLVFDHEPQETDPASIFNGTGNTRYATTRVKALNAQAHGALAILIVAEPNRKHPSNQERQARIGGSITRSNPIPSQALADDQLRIPSAILSNAAARELLAGAGAPPAEIQRSIDRDLKPQSLLSPSGSRQNGASWLCLRIAMPRDTQGAGSSPSSHS